MRNVTITGFEPTFDVVHFEAMHRNFARKVTSGQISIDDALSAACSASYDPARLYNALQPHLAVRDADRIMFALRAGSYVVGGITGLVAPYFITDDPHGFVICVAGVIGALTVGLPTLALTDTLSDSNAEAEYDLAYAHIGAVVAALQEKHHIHKPLAEELVLGEGSYKVLRSRKVEPGTGFVESTVRYSLCDSQQAIDLFVVNGVPQIIMIKIDSNLERQKTRTLVSFDYDLINLISFPQATLQEYQEAIQQYGRLTVRN